MSKIQRMTALCGLIFMVPAIFVNIEIGMASERGMAHMTAAVAMVIGAGLSGIILGKALRDKAFGAALASAIVLAVLTIMNITNALGLASHDRSERRSEASAAVAKLQRLEDRKRTLEDMIKTGLSTSSNLSSAKVQADIDAKKLQAIYTRSRSCADVTLDDSRVFCGELFDLGAKLSAASDVESARGDLAKVVSELASAQVAPESLDPQADNVLAFIPWKVDAKDVGLAINGWWALCIELMASLMPGLVAFMARPAAIKSISGFSGTGADPRPEKPEAVEFNAKPRSAPKLASSLESFLACLVKRSGSVLSAADLLAAYCQHCQDLGIQPETQRALGMAMTAAGYSKETRGNVRYIGVALRGVRPCLAVVSS
jgi:hypothetical protein